MASITKRNGNFQARVTTYIHGKRRYATRSFPKKAMAQKWANDLEIQKYVKDGVIQTNELFSDYFENWYHIFKEPTIKIATKKRYENSLKVVAREFTGVKLKDVTRAEYQAFLNAYGKTHALASTHKLHTHIKASVHDAIDDKIINFDFTKRAKISGHAGKSADTKYLELHDMKNLIAELKLDINPHHPTKTMALVSLYTGLRFEEVCGLTWADVSEKFGTISVNKAWMTLDNDGFGPTKNEQSKRVVTTNSELFEILNKYHEAIDRLQLKSKFKLIFFTSDGTPPSNNACNTMLSNTLKAIHSDKIITFHGLRHTHASYLIYQNISLYALSSRLGHASYVVTLNTYAHVMQAMQSIEKVKINNALNELSTSQVKNSNGAQSQS